MLVKQRGLPSHFTVQGYIHHEHPWTIWVVYDCLPNIIYLQEPFADCRHRPKSESERGSCTFRADPGSRTGRIFEKGGLLYPVGRYLHAPESSALYSMMLKDVSIPTCFATVQCHLS